MSRERITDALRRGRILVRTVHGVLRFRGEVLKGENALSCGISNTGMLYLRLQSRILMPDRT